MAKSAAVKKAAPKKGKFFLNFSLAAWHLDKKWSGPCSQLPRQTLHGLGLAGRRGASLAEVVEVEMHFANHLWKKSGPMISSWVREREFKKLNLSINKNQLDVDDLTDFILSLQPQLRRQQRKHQRSQLSRNQHQRSQLRRQRQRRRVSRSQRRHECIMFESISLYHFQTLNTF